MPNLAHVLVQDPTGKLPPGHVITESRELAVLKLNGSVVLPVDDDLCQPNQVGALDGFFIRSWGKGWLATKGSGERCCPMMLRVLPERVHVYWAARIAPVKGMQATGRIRLVSDTAHPAYISAGLAHKTQPDLLENLPLDARGGWTLEGVSSINVVSEGLLALNLYAVARNARIMWSAVSLSSFGNQQ